MLSIILRTEGNQTMKFGQLRPNNMSNILNILEKAYTKNGEKTIRRPFSKKSKLDLFIINSLNFYADCFNCMPSCGRTKYIETKFQTTKLSCKSLKLTCLFDIFFRKQKQVLNQSSLLLLCFIVEEKCCTCYIMLTDQIQLSVFLYFVRYWEIYVL